MPESCCVWVTGTIVYPAAVKLAEIFHVVFYLRQIFFLLPPLPEHLSRVYAYFSISSIALYRLQLYIAYSSKSPLALCRLQIHIAYNS